MICKKCGEEGKVMYKDKDIDLCFDCLVERDKEMTSRDAVNFKKISGKRFLIIKMCSGSTITINGSMIS